MGRYYSGDIEGKFWFGVQSSNDASFFGGEEMEPTFISYHFDKSHLKKIKDGIIECKKALGKNLVILENFFKEGGKGYLGYNDEMLVKAGIPLDQTMSMLEWYARLSLGEKILKCVKEKGVCEFDAEL